MTLRLVHVPGSNFVPGDGERRACVHAEACFEAWARYTMRHGIDAAGHCSATCCAFEPEARS